MERSDDGVVQSAVLCDGYHAGQRGVSATRRYGEQHVLKRRISHRYAIAKLGLTGPLLQLSKTVAGEVCTVLLDRVFAALTRVDTLDPGASHEQASGTHFGGGATCGCQASACESDACDELDVDRPC